MFGPRIGLRSLSFAFDIFFKESKDFKSFLDFVSPNPGILVTESKMSLWRFFWRSVDFFGEPRNGFDLFWANWNCCNTWATWSIWVMGTILYPLLNTISSWYSWKYWLVISDLVNRKTTEVSGRPRLISAHFASLTLRVPIPEIMSPSSWNTQDLNIDTSYNIFKYLPEQRSKDALRVDSPRLPNLQHI